MPMVIESNLRSQTRGSDVEMSVLEQDSLKKIIDHKCAMVYVSVLSFTE